MNTLGILPIPQNILPKDPEDISLQPKSIALVNDE